MLKKGKARRGVHRRDMGDKKVPNQTEIKSKTSGYEWN